MRALVISGGGSKGAFAGGVAQYLMETLDYEYDLYLGTSTGSLLCPHLAIGDINKIRNIYINTKQSDIFSNCPFKIKEKTDGSRTIGIAHLNVLKNFINRSRTFGESYHLLDLIVATFSKADFERLQQSKKEVICTVSNLSKHRIEYKSSKDCSYEEFCKWMWISCNFVPFMTLETIDGSDYADGSLGVSVAIEEAIRRGAKTVDTIILDVEEKNIKIKPVKNAFTLMSNMFAFTKNILESQNIQVAKDFARIKGIEINFYYTPYRLTNNPLVFNQKEMELWWTLGKEYAAKCHPVIL